jgi:2-oxoglutarate ferredoxin oxidoreductase subunit delta
MNEMPKAIVNEDICKGCGLCTTVCPKKIMQLDTEKMNKNGFYIAHVTDMSKCIGCAMCAVMCPDMAITVEK